MKVFPDSQSDERPLGLGDYSATWHVIRHYSGMSEKTIQNMERLVDDPSNGMMLQYDIYDMFDKLKVYLEQTE